MILLLSAARGRGAALFLLALISLGNIIFGESLWSPARNLLFDRYQRLMPRQVSQFPVLIVDIDDDSLAAVGRWPWPRTRLAQLIDATQKLGALTIGLDIIMPEADNLSPEQLLAERKDASPSLRAALAGLPSNDAILARVLRQAPSVIARAALIDGVAQQVLPLAYTPMAVAGASPVPFLQKFSAQLANIPEIEAAAAGRGYLNDLRDGDGVVRSMPVVISMNGTLAPALALELLRVASGQFQYTIRADRDGMAGIQLGSLFAPTDRDGSLRIYYSLANRERRVSAAAILQGALAPQALANRVVIIGATAVGIGDVAATPVAARMDGVEIQAQLVENILFGTRLTRLPQARWWELSALVALGLLLVIMLPRLRPGHGVGIYFAAVAAFMLISFGFFWRLRMLYDPTFAAAANGFVVLLLLTVGFSASDRRRRELDHALELERQERLRAAGELRAARDIQMGMLPDPRAIAGLPAALDFFALLEPAQEVGGDLYDAFMLDDRRLCFMIGDVSGKGVPASLFMALIITLSKSLARREHVPLDLLLRSVNDEISRENPTSMFVTAIIGIADARSGEVELCNAGHNPPVLLRSQEAPRQLDGADGPPLCVDNQFPYSIQRLKLAPGDVLVFTTDGVSEAEDKGQNQYGSARLLDCYAAGLPADATAACQNLYADVKRFTAGAAVSDDLTIMALHFACAE